MTRKVFRLTGSFRARHHVQPFSREIVADSAAAAKETLLSRLGSKHRVPRRLITITKTDEVPFDQVGDPVVRHEAELKR